MVITDDEAIKTITLKVQCQNHIGTAYIYDIALVEENVRTYTYDDNGNVKTTTQMNTTPISNTYNSTDDIIKREQGTQSVEYTYYTNNPHRVKTMTQDGVTVEFSYNSGGTVSVTQIKNESNYDYLKSSNIYSADGNNQTYYEDVNNQEIWYTYENGLLKTIRNENYVTTTYDYDPSNGRQIGASVSYISNYQTIHVASVSYSYLNGALEEIERGDEQKYTFIYDDFGNTTQILVGDYILVTYEYEENNGKLLKTTYGNNVCLENVYDELDRIIGIKINGVTKYTYAYNGNGDLYEIEDLDNNITTCYNYDSLDRLISSWQQVGDYVDSYTYYSYDDKGRAYRSDFSLMGTAGGALTQTYTYAYDEGDGSLASINVSYAGATPISNTISYNYDSLKRLSTKTYGTDSFQIAQNYTYVDLPGTRTGTQVTGYSVNINNTTAKNYSYTYDNLGNILTISLDDTVIYEYMYDAQGQLIDEILWPENYGIEYVYDDYGNIQTATKYDIYSGEPLEDVTQDVYGYGDENGWYDRLTSFNGGSITYDTIGNPIDYYNGKEAYYFVWQNGRELASASYGHSTVYYKYGADGLRVQKNVDGAVHDYYYSDGLLVREVITYGYGYVEILDFLYDESGTPYSFIYGFVNSGNVYTTQYYYVKNLQNDVIAIVDEYGNMAAEYTYDAWGNVLYINEYLHDCIGAINPIRYRSYYYDTETGFYYLQSRYYDPSIRRFINADGYLNANGDFIGFNMYAYCGNNPVMNVDYSGNAPDWNMFLQGALFATCGILTVVAVVSTGGTCIPAVALAYATLGTAGVAATAVGVSEMYEAVEGNNPIRDTVGEENYDLLKYGSATVMSFGGAILETGMSISVCFIAGTEVLSESGHRLIENIEAGDYVWATNPETGETDLKRVVQTFENETSELIHITVNGEEIVCTNEHPFYVPVKGWTAACQLRAGECLQLVNGEYVIVEQVQHEILESPIKVYNFEVEDFHTYYVGNSDILVHNDCGPNGKYETSPAHIRGNSIKSPPPKNGQAALDNSIQVKGHVPRRVSIYDGEIVVFQQTTPGVFHGYVVQWDKLSNDIKNALIKSGWVNRKGKIQ